jgi:hypothetical protein
MQEIFKPITNFENYSISNFGRVRNNTTGLFRSSSLYKGYPGIPLRDKNKKQKQFSIHRLVAEAFLQNDDPINKTVINHKDGNRKNSDVLNLEFTTPSANSQHAHDNGLIKQSMIPVNQLTKDGVFVKMFESITQASIELKCDLAGIAHVCRQDRRIRTCGGYKWEFANKNHGIHISLPEDAQPIRGYENYYSVTKCGKIYSHYTKRFMATEEKDGYESVGLSLNGKVNNFYVHRLVALSFIENMDPETKNYINHKNSIRNDNNVENLEWITASDNSKHMHQAKKARHQ